MKHIAVAIDGPAGAGKSTVAKRVADRLKFLYVDTGAMYRAITLKAMRCRIPFNHKEILVEMTEQTSLLLGGNINNYQVIMDGCDVSNEIRTEEVSRNTHFTASIREIREILWKMQRTYRETFNIVMEGRDIGSVVFPDAEVKIFLDASVEERAKRRYLQLKDQGIEADLEKIQADIAERDRKDTLRQIAPLVKLPDSVYINSTGMTIEEEVDRIVQLVKNLP